MPLPSARARSTRSRFASTAILGRLPAVSPTSRERDRSGDLCDFFRLRCYAGDVVGARRPSIAAYVASGIWVKEVELPRVDEDLSRPTFRRRRLRTYARD